MFDPFQAQRRPARAEPAKTVSPLRDTSPDAARMKPRGKRLLHAVKLLDVLSKGDEDLYGYLSSRTAGAKAAPPSDPFAANRGMGGQPAEDLPLPETAPPPVGTQAFQDLKEELRQQCREAVREETGSQENVVYLAPCGLRFHRIHWVDDEGEIIRHYRPEDLDTPLLRMADELLCKGFVMVEVHGSFPEAGPGTVLYAVRESGGVEKVRF